MNRQLDGIAKLVAEHVMEEPEPKYHHTTEQWAEWVKHDFAIMSEGGNWEYRPGLGFVPDEWRSLPFPTDIAAAWRVVEKMITGTAYECYISHQTSGWVCFFTSPGDPEGLAHEPTVTRAISIAACRARGVSKDVIQEVLDAD